jgi:hypothetical protein
MEATARRQYRTGAAHGLQLYKVSVNSYMLTNPRDEAFCQAFVRSGNASEAWRVATGKSKNADVHGAEFMVKHGIKERIAEIRKEMEQAFTMNREQWLERFMSIADRARNAEDRTAERQALREIGLAMPAWYSADRKEVAVTATTSAPTAEQLLSNLVAVEAICRSIAGNPKGREVMRRALAEVA